MNTTSSQDGRMAAIRSSAKSLRGSKPPSIGISARLEKHFIPALDALTLMWAASRTKSTIIEIGSGNSTLFLRRALESTGISARLISIDPCPRVQINALCDEIIRRAVENTDLLMFENLEAGDVVFVDNSHRSFMNSDVTVVMLDILPRLKPGVLVGFHD